MVVITTTVSVGFGNSPALNISSTELCLGKSATITAVGANTYSWNTGSNASSFVVTPSNSSPLSFTVIGADAIGCLATETQVFNISDQCQLIVYNGVTPNGDSHNDFFRIENIEQYPGNVVTIFNRWGQKIDEIENYNNTNNFWAGTNNSKTVPSGTYYYIIDLKNGSELLKGYIELTKRDTN
ncbi:MAG: gliding motility-associated C-terminal domain-containing protein [Sphingobacteriaceae bacterium]|nr:gliding motility-associated C-terminal domain-containing protein [Sphingobacteriaceae bacterium]